MKFEKFEKNYNDLVNKPSKNQISIEEVVIDDPLKRNNEAIHDM